VFSGNTLSTENTTKFEEGISLIERFDFDLIVLDLYNDKGSVDESAGRKVLGAIQKTAFIPVIFYTGHAHKIQDLVSEVVGVVNKGEGFDNLKAEIQRIVDSKIALLKGQVYSHLRESLRQYFWETVHAEKNVFEPIKNDISLGYLLLRRFANSLSKENIKELLGDDKIKTDKAHPMEFYIFPSNTGEYEAGELISKSSGLYAILTPTCDFSLRTKKDGSTDRKVGKVLLAKIDPLKTYPQYVAFKQAENKENMNKLISLITNNQSDRFFFLPFTPFIENSIIDFQNKTMIDYAELKTFVRVAKLDDPYAQSMISSFIRYYNRIGFPDIDSDYIMANLK
jgi:CheY-like chemotaxis protein